MKAILLNGSPAKGSRVRAALDYMVAQLEEQSAEASVLDLMDLGLLANDPVFHADATQHPDDRVKTFAQNVAEADVVVLATPLYHGSYSGLLKVALDNLDGDAFAGKKVVLLSNASGMRNATQAAQELIIVARTMSGDVHGSTIGTCKADYEMVDSVSTLTSPEIRDRIARIAAEVTG